MVMGIKIKEIMTKPAIKINHNISVQMAAKEMVEHRIGSIVVVKNKSPVGIITEADINRKIVAPGKDPKKIKAVDIMSSPIVFANPDDDVEIAVEKMEKHKIKRLPVIEKGKIVGLIADTDIARAAPEMIDILNFRLKMRTEMPSIREGSTSGICESCGAYSDDLRLVNGQWTCENCREE